MRVTVQVTEKHIEKARKLMERQTSSLAMCCPVAVALKEKTGKPAAVLYTKVELGYRGHRALKVTHSAPMPVKASRFIYSFDNKLNVRPTTLTFNFKEIK